MAKLNEIEGNSFASYRFAKKRSFRLSDGIEVMALRCFVVKSMSLNLH